MVNLNQLIINGKSNSDFPFDVYVTNKAGYNYAKKKNILDESTYITGATKNEVNAYQPIEKPYTIICPTADLKELREITAWLSDSGTLISDEEPDVFYEILDVDVANAPKDVGGWYPIDVVFTTMPFGYELNQVTKTYTSGQQVINHTNAPMFPRIDIYGNSSTETTIQIGNQTVKLRYLNEKITIESKPLEQNVYDKNGRELNSVMSGNFIEFEEGTMNRIVLSSGIQRIEMLERWGWR